MAQLVEREKCEGHDHKAAQQHPFDQGTQREGQFDVGRQQSAQQHRQRHLQQNAHEQADGGPDQAQNGDHGVEVQRDKAARGAQCLDDGDGRVALAQKGGQRALDADAGQQQREDGHQAEKEEQVVEEALHAGRRGAIGLDALLAQIAHVAQLVRHARRAGLRRPP